MASNESFNRRERARAKKLKADAKRERRQSRGEVDPDAEPVESTPKPEVDQGAVIAKLEKLTKAFDDGDVDFDTFEEQRAELLAQLVIE